MENKEYIDIKTKPIPHRSKRSKDGLCDLVNYVNQYIKTKEFTAFEIGTWVGDGTIIFAKNFKQVVTIDPFTGRFSEKENQIEYNMLDVEKEFYKNTKLFSNINLIKGKNEKVHNKFGAASFVYIDGLHNYESVKLDINNWWGHLRRGGFLCGHDYNAKKFPGVVKAVNEFMGKIKVKELITFKDSSWLIRKV